MEEILKQDKSKSHKEFEKLVAEDLSSRRFKEGTLVQGIVEEIGKKFVFLDLGLKSSGAVPIEEFKLTKIMDKIAIGTKVEVFLEKIEDRNLEVVVSVTKAKKQKSWTRMKNAFLNKEEVTGIILNRVKGGFCVMVGECPCFLPGSQVDIKPLRNFDHLFKVPQTFECVKLDEKRGNIVLSRRSILEKARDKGRDKLMSSIKEGDIVTGLVKNITKWGAFCDLNGLDALLHITDISWSRINSPEELLSVGMSLKLKISKIDAKTKKISVSLKDLTADPYKELIDKYEIGKTYPAVVTKITDYGCFAKLGEGLEGLIHQSHLSHLKKNPSPFTILSTSQKISVVLLEKDISKRRLSLSYKDTMVNPWIKFAQDYKTGDEVETKVKNITNYAIFFSIKDTGLDGMCHYKNLSWQEKESDLERYKKNQIARCKILEIDQKNEKIRLGIRELTEDPFEFFMKKRVNVGDIVTTIVDRTAKNGIYVKVGNKNLSIFIKQSELSKDASNCRVSRFTPGDKTDCMITNIKKNERVVHLSIKSLEEKQSKDVLKKFGSEAHGGVLGELLGPLIKKKKNKK